MKAELKNIKGEKKGSVDLPKSVFGVELNTDLVHQVVRAQEANRRQNSAHAKDRSEVRGGGRKPWRQKGTGRARHGSRRSPIFKGGGVTFGPRNERNFKSKINKKARRKSLLMVLSEKNRQNMITFLEQPELPEAKTKAVSGFISQETKGASTLMILPDMNKNIILSVRNIENADTIQAKDINPLDLLSYKHLIVIDSAIDVIKEKFTTQ